MDAAADLGRIAEARAFAQLMRVPWSKFGKAYEEYPRWHGLTLWIRSFDRKRSTIQSAALKALNEYCPEFLDSHETGYSEGLLALKLSEWIHHRVFAAAKTEGWLDALIFYGVRHVLSEGALACWNSSENIPHSKKPLSLSFDQWWHMVVTRQPYAGVTLAMVADSVKALIDWHAFLLWIRPLTETDSELPAHVTATLNQKYPGFLDPPSTGIKGLKTKWPLLNHYMEGRLFAGCRERNQFEDLQSQVDSNPRCLRIARYSEVWDKIWREELKRGYPAFMEWRSRADSYTEA